MNGNTIEHPPIPPSEHLLVMDSEIPSLVDDQPAKRSHVRILLSLFDQAAVSITNVGTSMLLSRAFGKDQLGLYYVGFQIATLIGEAQNSLVTTAHMMTAPRLKDEALRKFNGSALLHQFWLSIVITFLLAMAAMTAWTLDKPEYVALLMACSIITTSLGLRNFGRIFSFATHNPLRATILDSIATFLQLGLILLLKHMGWASGWSAMCVVGIANTAAGVYWIIMARKELAPTIAQALSDLKGNWMFSRWIFASGAMWNMGMGFYPSLVAAIRGAAEAGTWGNCFSLSSFSNPLLMGMQNWIGPAVAHAYTTQSRRSFSRYVVSRAMLFAGAMIPFAVFLGAVAHWVLPRMFKGESPSNAHVVIVLAASCLFQAFNYTISRGLFSLNRADLDMWANLGPILVLLVAGTVLVHHQGAFGAALSFVLSQMIGSMIRGIAFLRVTAEPVPMGVTA